MSITQVANKVQDANKVQNAIKVQDTNKMLAEDFLMRPAGMDDLGAVVELFNLCSLAVSGQAEADAEEFRLAWQTPGFDLGQSSRMVVSPDGSPVGYIELWDLQAIPSAMWVRGRVHPEYEGAGIGTRLMGWAKQRAVAAFPRVPADAKVSLIAGTLDSHLPAKRLFDRFGMVLVREYADMMISLDQPIPEPKWPENIVVRTYVDLPDLARVHAASEEAFQDHFGWTEQPEEDGLERWKHHIENDKQFDPTLWFLAVEGDEIAGVCLCRPTMPEDPLLAFVDELGVRRPWRRRGIALALLHHTFAEFKRRGSLRVGLGVDTASLTGAHLLYERAGMHVDRRFATYEMTLRPGRDLARREAD